MTAPAAPNYKVRSDGHRLYVRWLPVLDATDYNVYVADDYVVGFTASPEAQVADTDVGDDGWFTVITDVFCGPVRVSVTALNSDDEESDVGTGKGMVLNGNADPKPDLPLMNRIARARG